MDSEFGFEVADFFGAAQKILNYDYMEGWIGNITEESQQAGVAVSNAETATFKAKFPTGTWCLGLGSNSVKCESEHYTVMEHLISCNETVPYFYATENGPGTPISDQMDLYEPDGDPTTNNGELVGNCGTLGLLSNTLEVLVSGVPVEPLVPDPTNVYVPNMPANESTVLDLIATGNDYGMTKKDDGKVLYRWGNMVKKPNDVRLYARIPLPDPWKAVDAPAEGYEVTKALLYVDHTITNNPNDQIRPEDMENEGATGRKPGYTVEGDNWVSDKQCYEGDGDFIPAGTLLKNAAYGRDP